MKKKSASQSAFFNPRVLLGLFIVLAGVFLALFATPATERTRRAEANPPRFRFGPATAGSAQIKHYRACRQAPRNGSGKILCLRVTRCMPHLSRTETPERPLVT